MSNINVKPTVKPAPATTEQAAADVISEVKQANGITTEQLMDMVTEPVVDGGMEEHPAAPRKPSQKKIDPSALSEALIGLGTLQAIPLAMPEATSLKPRDPAVMFRWVNYKTEDGSRVWKFKQMGFDIAEPEDVEGTLPGDCTKASVGITIFDTVLMKISKLRLLQAYEANHQKSLKNVGRVTAHRQAIERAVDQLRQDMAANNIPADYVSEHVEFFQPSEKQAEALNR